MKILLDTNIIIDIALERPPFVGDSVRILKNSQLLDYTIFVTSSSITDIHYICSKPLGKAKSLSFLKQFVALVECCWPDKQTVLEALNANFKDFEDAVQYFSALNAGIDAIVTRNEKDYKQAKQVEILNPKQFVNTYLKDLE